MAEGIDYATAYQMNVFVHVVRPSDGIAGSDYTIASVSSTILSNLNEYFANTNISFVLSGSDYIDSDEFINMTVDDFDNDETFSEFLSINRVSNAINVYVLSEAPNLRYNKSARVESIVGTAYLVVEDYYKESTISHEMGHCLGLYHTHHGTRAIIITTNLPFTRWEEIIKDKVLCSALVDRICHKAHMVNMTGQSYRVRETQKMSRM